MSLINTMNNLGASFERDSEAEYRLLTLGRKIIDAKKSSTDVSYAVKSSYGSSVIGTALKGRDELIDATKASPRLAHSWAEVAAEMQSVIVWFNGALREDYSEACIQCLTPEYGLFEKLKEKGLTRDYMKWAFEEMRLIAAQHTYPVDALLACYQRISDYAMQCSDAVIAFHDELARLRQEPDFALYDYIFDHLALKAEKPKLFELDEAYFAATCTFDIYYEALEQLTRQAHILVPGTHDQKFENFNLKFTEPKKPGLDNQPKRFAK